MCKIGLVSAFQNRVTSHGVFALFHFAMVAGGCNE